MLEQLNNQLYDDLSHTELLFSVFYARYNNRTRSLTYANAGHNLPIVFRTNTHNHIELDAEGLIIGVMPSITFEERSIELSTGDVIIFYTDGFSESTNSKGILFGKERILSILRSNYNTTAEAIIDQCYMSVEKFSESSLLQDDISIIIMKIY